MIAASIDVMDQTLVVTERPPLAAYFADERTQQAWWPDLELTLEQERGLEGQRWTVAGELMGSAEIWLERWHDGVIVHWFLRAEPTSRRQAVATLARRYAMSYKNRVHALKDEWEHARPAGVPRLPVAG